MSGEGGSGGGGIVSVSSADQLDRIHRLEQVAGELRLAATALDLATPSIPAWRLAAAALPSSVGQGTQAIDDAVVLLRQTADRASALAAASRTVLGAYGELERGEKAALAATGSVIGAVGSHAVRMLATDALFLAPAALAALLLSPMGPSVIIAGAAIAGTDPRGRAMRAIADVLLGHPELVSNPVTANVVRMISAGADEGISGFLGAPVEESLGAGELGVGQPGTTAATAELLVVLRAAGAFRETEVRTQQVEGHLGSVRVTENAAPLASRGVTAPTTLAERVDRIPRLDQDGQAQVRIERFQRSGRPDGFAVYIAGTAEWQPEGGATPFDLTSDLSQKGGERSGAYRAVEQAMRQAGVRSDSQVVFVGHSLGGLLAHDLAASGEWNAAGVLEVGSPPSDHPALDGVPDVMLENDSDIVPALGERAADDAVIIRAHPFGFDDVPPASAGDPVPAHSRDVYTRMAGLADASDDATVQDAIAALNRVSEGATVSTTYFHSVRVRP